MKIQINVTKEVIKKAIYCADNTEQNCAIALAVREIFPNACVSAKCLYFHIDEDEHVSLPPHAQVFISLFDFLSPTARASMFDISFEINVPDEVIQQIGIGQVYKILSESRTLSHVN